jgi:hypothetical protein
VERSLVRLQDLAGKPILGFRAQEAERYQVADRGEFIHADFLEFDLKDTFDISIAREAGLRDKEIIRIPSGDVFVLVGGCATGA